MFIEGETRLYTYGSIWVQGNSQIIASGDSADPIAVFQRGGGENAVFLDEELSIIEPAGGVFAVQGGAIRVCEADGTEIRECKVCHQEYKYRRD